MERGNTHCILFCPSCSAGEHRLRCEAQRVGLRRHGTTGAVLRRLEDLHLPHRLAHHQQARAAPSRAGVVLCCAVLCRAGNCRAVLCQISPHGRPVPLPSGPSRRGPLCRHTKVQAQQPCAAAASVRSAPPLPQGIAVPFHRPLPSLSWPFSPRAEPCSCRTSAACAWLHLHCVCTSPSQAPPATCTLCAPDPPTPKPPTLPPTAHPPTSTPTHPPHPPLAAPKRSSCRSAEQ